MIMALVYKSSAYFINGWEMVACRVDVTTRAISGPVSGEHSPEQRDRSTSGVVPLDRAASAGGYFEF
jgi:hypothetical protein